MSFFKNLWEVIDYKGSEAKEAVGGLLGDVAGSSLSYIGNLLETDPERKARIEANAEALYERRANDPYKRWEGLGYTSGGYGQRSSRVTDGNWFENTTANLMHSLGDTYQDFSGIAQEPSQFIKIIGDATTGGILNLVGAEELGQEQQATADAFGGYLAKTYGSWGGFMHHLQTEPIYAIMDLMGAGWIAGKGLNAAEKLAQNPAFISQLESLAPAMEKVVNKYTSSLTPSAQGILAEGQMPFLAHHGNPEGARFRNFDFNRIGESHGYKEAWGLHASRQEATGVHFAGELDPVLSKAYNHRLQKHLTPIERDIWGQAEIGIRPKVVKERMYKQFPDKKAEIDVVMKEFEAMHDKSKAQLYEIDIHDSALPFMIHRELPMTQQPLAVQKLMKEHNMSSMTTGEQFYAKIAEDFAIESGASSGARELASKYLASKGIKGMELMDDITLPKQKMVDGVLVSEPPLWNYILFDDTSHTMLTRQGKKFEDVQLIDSLYAHRIGDVRAIKGGLLDPDLLGARIADLPKMKDNVINLADYEGYPWVGTQSDLTRASGLLEGVGDTAFQTPVRQRGGQGYMMDRLNTMEGRIWESNEGARNKIIGDIEKAQALETGKRPLLLPFALKPKSMDFAHQVTETLLESVIASLNKTQTRQLNSIIKKTKKDWKGVNSENPLENVSPDELKAIANIIDVNFRHIDGVLSLPEARLINADPMQLNKEPLTLMNMAITGKNPVGLTSSHPSYGYSVTGEPRGRLAEDISLLDLQKFKKEGGELITRENFGKGAGDDLRKVSMSHTYGLLTDKILRTLDDQGKLYGGLLK